VGFVGHFVNSRKIARNDLWNFMLSFNACNTQLSCKAILCCTSRKILDVYVCEVDMIHSCACKRKKKASRFLYVCKIFGATQQLCRQKSQQPLIIILVFIPDTFQPLETIMFFNIRTF
jgi:hypothetical protein